MTTDRALYAAVAISALIGSLATLAVSAFVTPEQGDAASVRAYLLEHPEVLPEAMEVLRARETAAAIDSVRPQLETPFGSAWAGAKDGDVVLVEFFDYACGYCRASLPAIDRLLAEDERLKIVFRELPILSEASEAAARASLAAARAGKFEAFHDAMYAAGPPSEATIAAAREESGVTATIDPAAARAEIERNVTLARTLGATGTPFWVVGDQVLSGAVGYEVLKQAIDDARAKG